MKPVILIPGFAGSILVKKGHEKYKPHPFASEVIYNRWVNLKTLTAPPSKEWRKDMHYGTRIVQDTRGIERVTGISDISADLIPYDIGGVKGVCDIIPEFDNLATFQQHHLNRMFNYRYFHNITESLVNAGYKDRKNLHGLPYDFRLVLDPMYREHMFQYFSEVIENTVKANGEKAVVVTHSMGGLLLKLFLTTHPYHQSLIDRWISISTPFGGSTYSLKVALCGEHYIPIFGSSVREELSRNTGVIMCFPNTIGYDPDEPLVMVEGRSDKSFQISVNSFDMLADMGVVQFQIWRDLFKPLVNVLEFPISIPTHVIMSKNNNTKGIFTVRSLGDQPTHSQFIPGDGIIPEKSLMAFSKIIYHPLLRETIITDSNRDHTSLLMDPHVINIIKRYALSKA